MIIWHQKSEKITGQSKVTQAVIDMQLHDHLVDFCISSKFILDVLKFFKILILNGANVIYFVPSRSKRGMLKDIPVIISALLGFKVIGHLHGSDSVRFFDFISRLPPLYFAYRKIYFISPSTIVTNAIVKKKFRCITIENFIHFESNPPSANIVKLLQRSALKSQHLVVWNSNVMASKGVFDVLAAIEMLYNEGNRITIFVFGLPIADVEMSIQQVAAELDRYSNKSFVEYLGARGPGDISELLKHANTVALPSRYPTECQPLGLIEAMCKDCNVLISDRNVLLETVGLYQNFICVEPNQEGIYRGLRKALLMKPRKCDDQTLQRFSYDRFKNEFSELVNSVTS